MSEVTGTDLDPEKRPWNVVEKPDLDGSRNVSFLH